MNGINLIMPMAGGGTRFHDERFSLPKPLIEIYGKPFFFWSARSVMKFAGVSSLTFAILSEHEEKFEISRRISEYFPEARFVVIPTVLRGAVLTCLEAVKTIDNDLPIVFNDCDHCFKSTEFNAFSNSAAADFDGALLTFKSDSPKYSFVRRNESGEITGTVEKQVVGSDAICGTYTFSSRALFEKCAEQYLGECSYAEFFMSGVYNVMLEKKMSVKTFGTDFHVSFGTPEEYDEALNDKNHLKLI